jgi:hypothetical protein
MLRVGYKLRARELAAIVIYPRGLEYAIKSSEINEETQWTNYDLCLVNIRNGKIRFHATATNKQQYNVYQTDKHNNYLRRKFPCL